MAGWRDNPVVAVIAVVAIIVACVAIYFTQIKKGGRGLGKAIDRNTYIGEIVGKEIKAMAGGEKVVAVVPGGKIGKAFLNGMKKTAEGVNITEVAEKTPEGPGDGPREVPEDPERLSLKTLVDAIQANKDAKCVACFVQLYMDPAMTDPALRKPIWDYLEGGGYMVMLGELGLGTTMDGRRDPFFKHLQGGNLILVCGKAKIGKTDKDPRSLTPQEYFETYKTVLKKDNLQAYLDEAKKSRSKRK